MDIDADEHPGDSHARLKTEMWVNTLILAFAVFMVVRMVNNMKARMAAEEAAAPAAPAPPPADVVLLTEIRDLLSKR
ncbi:MAG: hypothetical protein FJW30_16980 [Acidobacteria bacterium]|nr:hypothetical protein [Acidobacteriota bacterium]